jgi:hypothetical protein
MGTLRRSKQRTDTFLLARPAGSLSNFKEESSKKACSQVKQVMMKTIKVYSKWVVLSDSFRVCNTILIYFSKYDFVFISSGENMPLYTTTEKVL